MNWPDLETEVKNWMKDHKNNGISVPTRMIIVELRRWVGAQSIIDFAGTS